MKNNEIINQIEIQITQIHALIRNWKLEINKHEENLLTLTKKLQEIKTTQSNKNE